MKVVIGAYSFSQAAGTETYVATVARELGRLGHDAVVSAEELGPIADHAERSGVRIARDDGGLPDECDAVLANDAISAASLAEQYPDARIVQFAHSPLFDHQLPVLIPGAVSAVLVPSDLIADRVRAVPLDVPIVRTTHPIDTERFAPAGPIRPRPRQALLLSNYLRGDRRRAIVDAWGEAGVECVQVGGQTTAVDDVVPAIRDADIVVAKSRSALEGMSCARAVYVYDEFGSDGWVTPESYLAFEANNFAGTATPLPRTAEDLVADLDRYRPEMGWANHELVRTHHSARRHTVQLVEVLRGPQRRADGTTALSEIARLTRAGWASERRAVALEGELAAWRERTIAAENGIELQRERIAELEAELDRRSVRLGRALGRARDRLPRRK